MAGGLAWRPAPFARAFTRGGRLRAVTRAHREGRLARPHLLPRADWQGVERHAAHRVHDAGARVHCALWALGSALETHLVLTPDGAVLRSAAPAGAPGPEPVGPAVATGPGRRRRRRERAAAGRGVLRRRRRPDFEWAPLAGELAEIDATRASRLARGCGPRCATRCRRPAAGPSRCASGSPRWPRWQPRRRRAAGARPGQAGGARPRRRQAAALGARRRRRDAAASARDDRARGRGAAGDGAVSCWRER